MRRTGMGSDLQKPAADEGVAVLSRSLDGVLEGADAMVFPVPGRLRRTVFPSPEGRPDEETKLPDPRVSRRWRWLGRRSVVRKTSGSRRGSGRGEETKGVPYICLEARVSLAGSREPGREGRNREVGVSTVLAPVVGSGASPSLEV